MTDFQRIWHESPLCMIHCLKVPAQNQIIGREIRKRSEQSKRYIRGREWIRPSVIKWQPAENNLQKNESNQLKRK